jgi:hypothetical protein
MSNKVGFIRKNGKVVPISKKEGGDSKPKAKPAENSNNAESRAKVTAVPTLAKPSFTFSNTGPIAKISGKQGFVSWLNEKSILWNRKKQAEALVQKAADVITPAEPDGL